MTDRHELLDLDWGDQTSTFIRNWGLNGKRIHLDCWSSYSRSPDWCVVTHIELYFRDNASRGSFFHTIFFKDKSAEEYEREVVTLISNIVNSIDGSYNINTEIIEEGPFKEFVTSFIESMKGPTEEERLQYQKEINERCRD